MRITLKKSQPLRRREPLDPWEARHEKVITNLVFTKRVVKVIARCDRSKALYDVLCIDGKNGMTTRCLIKRGVEPQRIVVVNNKEKVGRNISETFGAAYAAGYLSTWLRCGDGLDNNEEPLAGIYLDQCATFRGNKYVKPEEDLKACFESSYVDDNTVIAMTVSLRAGKVYKITYDEEYRRDRRRIDAIVKGYGRYMKNIQSMRYGRMFFICFNAPKIIVVE
jgi:hypothetical protein